MINIPDPTIILMYILNTLLVIVIFFFIIRPLGKAIIHSVGKMVGTKQDMLSGNSNQENEAVQTLKEREKQRRLDEVKKQNEEIKQQAEKEVEAMESKIIADLFDGKAPPK